MTAVSAIVSAILLPAASAQTDAPSFRNEVMAVLSRAGCNRGTCHGNAHGKGGFKLSLRGQDPAVDYETLTRGVGQRRVNRLEPGESLLLLKALMRVPHQGGRRFADGSLEHRILADWIAGGLLNDTADTRLRGINVSPGQKVLIQPADKVQLSVTARWEDGSTSDVTALSVFEPAAPIVSVDQAGAVTCQRTGETVVNVRYLNQQASIPIAFVPARPNFEWCGYEPRNAVDVHVFAKLQPLRINPSPLCSDTVFVRRAWLDLLGRLPTADEARAFVQDPASDKRTRLIEDLLQRPGFADYQAILWADLLRAEEKTLDRKGVENYYAWIRESIARDKPINRFVQELVSGRGSTYGNPPANYYRAMRDPTTRAESTAQLFLGVRLQCARCHNHPFDRWTQDDYYSWAGLFARVQYKVLENRRVDRLDKHEYVGEQIVFMADDGEVTNVRTGQSAVPAFLGDGASVDPERDRLLQLAEWLTADSNTRFARMQVNRVWSQLFGRGIVDPIDDFRNTNPPSNPALLSALAEEFVAHNYSLRHLIRTIMRSHTYQASSEPNETNADDLVNFSHAAVTRLTAEQILTAIGQVCETPVPFSGFPSGIAAVELPGVRGFHVRRGRPALGDEFLRQFGKPERLQTCACERTNETALGQTFQMVSGPLISQLLQQPDNRVGRLLDSAAADEQMLEALYWTTLSRAPTESERSAGLDYLQGESRRAALEDIVWALLNSNEFLLRH